MTHDRYFLDNVAGWILELDRGTGIPYEGNYTGWLEQKQAPAGARGEGRDRSGSARCSASWTGSACRRARARPRARRASTPTSSCSARTRRRRSKRSRSTSRPARVSATSSSRRATCARPTATLVLFDDLTFTLPRGGIVGVIGPNGAGKTTMFRLITGQEQPDGGTLRLGETVQIGYVDQTRDALNAEQDACGRRSRGGDDEIDDGQAHGRVARLRVVVQLQGRAAAAQGGHAVGRRAQSRAPGQAAAHAAATCCSSTSRPTTSTSTRCARSKRRCSTSPAAPSSSATTAGSSTASRRTFWRSRATREAVWFEGNYQDYEADRKRRLGAAADQPHRIKYRKLTRRS